MRSKQSKAKRHSVRVLALALCCGGLSGCSTLSPGKSNDDSWSISKLWKKEYQEPASLAAIWSYDTLAVANEPTKRGFGGRIYFYNDRSAAVPVDGDLIVYGYLTTPGFAPSDGSKPDKKFEFTADKLSGHFSPSEIGASYSVWIPWDDEGGFREEITLIPAFRSKTGAVIQGAPAKVFLEGQSRVAEKSTPTRFNQVSYSRASSPTYQLSTAIADSHVGGYGLSSASGLKDVKTMRTTTIGVPGDARFGRSAKSLTLGASAKANDTGGPNSVSSTLGVSVGGGQGPRAIAPTSGLRSRAAQPAIQNGRPTNQQPSNIDLRSLTPPPGSVLPNGITDGPVVDRRTLPTVGDLAFPVQSASYQAPAGH